MASFLQNAKDTTFTKIFVGGLPYHTTNDTLREFFEQFGGIEEAVVINDRLTGKSKGYGFVTMIDRMAAERAIADPNPIIDGRKANVNLAYLGAKPKPSIASLSAALAPKAGVTAVLQGQNPLVAQYAYTPVTASYGVHPGLLSLTGNNLMTTQSLTTATQASPELSYAPIRSPTPAPAPTLQTNQMLTMAAMGYDMSQYMSGLGYMYSPPTAQAYTPIQQPTIIPASQHTTSTLPERV